MNWEDALLTFVYLVLVGLFFSYLIMVIACAVFRIEVKFDDEPEDEAEGDDCAPWDLPEDKEDDDADISQNGN